jgi:hypothetical protein
LPFIVRQLFGNHAITIFSGVLGLTLSKRYACLRTPERRLTLAKGRGGLLLQLYGSHLPYVRLAQRRPSHDTTRFEGLAGRPAQRLNHERRARWIVSPTLDLMCTRRRFRSPMMMATRSGPRKLREPTGTPVPVAAPTRYLPVARLRSEGAHVEDHRSRIPSVYYGARRRTGVLAPSQHTANC